MKLHFKTRAYHTKTTQAIRTIFRDNGFTRDDVKVNITQIFKQLSPETDIKTI